MLALTLVLVVAGVCPEGTGAALTALESRANTLRAEASLLKNPREQKRVEEAVASLDDAIGSLRAEIGCRDVRPSVGADGLPTTTTAAPSRPETLDAPGTRALLAVLAGERFDDVRLSALESGLVGRCIDANSARQILDVFRADAPRLEAWRRIAPRLTEREQAGALVLRLGSEKTRAAGKTALQVPVVAGCVDDTIAEAASDRPQ